MVVRMPTTRRTISLRRVVYDALTLEADRRGEPLARMVEAALIGAFSIKVPAPDKPANSPARMDTGSRARSHAMRDMVVRTGHARVTAALAAGPAPPPSAGQNVAGARPAPRQIAVPKREGGPQLF
jgi:hypothetical protein